MKAPPPCFISSACSSVPRGVCPSSSCGLDAPCCFACSFLRRRNIRKRRTLASRIAKPPTPTPTPTPIEVALLGEDDDEEEEALELAAAVDEAAEEEEELLPIGMVVTISAVP